eukprot:4324416-Pleurochrysis_carterae.AAC.1
MRWAGGVVYSAVGEEFCEFGGQELARVVSMQCADRVSWGVGASVKERIEGGHETAHTGGSIGFVFQELNSFKSRVVINENEQ